MNPSRRQGKISWRRRLVVILVGLICAYGLLLWPERAPDIPTAETSTAFQWNRDAYWNHLEKKLEGVKSRQLRSVTPPDQWTENCLHSATGILDSCETYQIDPASVLYERLEYFLFELGASAAVEPTFQPEFFALQERLRRTIKNQSLGWNLNSKIARDRLYRLLYGSRMAVEEVMLQALDTLPPLVVSTDEPSQTPSKQIYSVTIHSGDILVSRGGAPTSALIARGSDYPGNFSHVALVHIDELSGEVSIIESHIECGVAVATIDEYLADTKLRILVLRLRSDLRAVASDPMLPHKAATLAHDRARREHTAYDFSMDYHDNSELFCSEVASDPYSQFGVRLWQGTSSISSPGARAWLAAFGVRHFVTLEPSDLEYDPQLRVIAEWRDPETLWQDHLDNAVIDAMLEGAEAGERLEYDWHLLPFARLLKGYSVLKNLFGGVGPIPEGMSATAALTNDWFTRRHAQIRERLTVKAEAYERAGSYRAPYWELVRLAREAVDELPD